MQHDDKNVIIQNWLIKADEALNEVQKAIDTESLSSAQNRIYYSIFYSVMALGYSRDFVTSKHSQLLGWFNQTFVKEKIFDKKFGEIYKTAYENRMRSDYTYTYKPEKEKIINAFSNAKSFVEATRNFILKEQENL